MLAKQDILAPTSRHECHRHLENSPKYSPLFNTLASNPTSWKLSRRELQLFIYRSHSLYSNFHAAFLRILHFKYFTIRSSFQLSYTTSISFFGQLLANVGSGRHLCYGILPVFFFLACMLRSHLCLFSQTKPNHSSRAKFFRPVSKHFVVQSSLLWYFVTRFINRTYSFTPIAKKMATLHNHFHWH